MYSNCSQVILCPPLTWPPICQLSIWSLLHTGLWKSSGLLFLGCFRWARVLSAGFHPFSFLPNWCLLPFFVIIVSVRLLATWFFSIAIKMQDLAYTNHPQPSAYSALPRSLPILHIVLFNILSSHSIHTRPLKSIFGIHHNHMWRESHAQPPLILLLDLWESGIAN